MKCTCGGDSEVLARRGLRRRRRCLVCGRRWSTLEVRTGVKAPTLPPSLAKLGNNAKPPKPAMHEKPAKLTNSPNNVRRRDVYDVPDENVDDTNDYLHSNMPEIFTDD